MEINNTIKEFSFLYELALSIGQSGDLTLNCSNFLSSFMSWKNQDFGGVWVKNNCIPNSNLSSGFKLIYAHPKIKIEDKNIANSLFLKNCFNDSPAFSKKLSNDLSKIINFSSKEAGIINFFQLTDIGFLVIYSSKGENIWTQNELTMFTKVMEKFANSIKTCLINQKSIDDLITLSKTRNAQVIAKKEVEESNQLKSAFLSNISHEIRTPINAIVGFSSLLSDKDISANEHGQFIRLIEQNSRKLLKHVDNLIDVSKIDSNQLILKEETFDIDSLIRDLELKYNNKPKRKDNITIQAIRPENCDTIRITTDKGRLLQIFENLIDNAIKFTKSGCIEYGYYLEISQNPIFYIKDTGVGIPIRVQNAVFDVFRQGDNSSIRNFEGSGIGLSLCKKLISLLGGEIWFQSKEGVGSNFYFRLAGSGHTRLNFINSKSSSNIVMDTDLKTNSLKYSRRQILIAEDVKSNFNYLNAIIEMTDAKVLWAKNGKDAISICQSDEQVDLILMDIRMPEIGGLEAIKKIKLIAANTPVIVQTAFSLNNEKEECLRAGADEFITKPIDPRTLITILKKYLD